MPSLLNRSEPIKVKDITGAWSEQWFITDKTAAEGLASLKAATVVPMVSGLFLVYRYV